MSTRHPSLRGARSATWQSTPIHKVKCNVLIRFRRNGSPRRPSSLRLDGLLAMTATGIGLLKANFYISNDDLF